MVEVAPEVVNVDVTQVAVPLERVWAVQPVIGVPPTLKVTVPVGVPPAPETVAVMVVDPPTVVGLGEADSVVVVDVWLTVRV